MLTAITTLVWSGENGAPNPRASNHQCAMKLDDCMFMRPRSAKRQKINVKGILN